MYVGDNLPAAVERQQVRALVILCLIMMLFSVAFQQSGSTLIFWTRDNADRTLGGLLKHEFDPILFFSINPFFVIFLTPLVLWLFGILRRRGTEPSTPAKIALGMLFTAASCAIMLIASLRGGDYGRVSPLWVIITYLVLTFGEILLAPTGLSMVTRLAPRRMAARMMGVWFAALWLGNTLAGCIGFLWTRWPHHWFFGMLVTVSALAAVLIALQLRRLNAATTEAGLTLQSAD